MATYPLINGFAPSFSSITLKVDGQEYVDFDSIDFSDGMTPGRSKGAGTGIPLGSTPGEWDGTASITMQLAMFNSLEANLGDGFGRKVVTITVQFAEDGQDITTVTLVARLIKPSLSASAGADPIKVSCDLFLLQPILWNGYAVEALPDTTMLAGA